MKEWDHYWNRNLWISTLIFANIPRPFVKSFVWVPAFEIFCYIKIHGLKKCWQFLPEHYLRSGLINTKNILFSKINSLYAQYDIDAGWVMTILLYKNTVLFSAVFAGIKNPASREQNHHFKRSPHCEKGRSAHFGSLFDWNNYFTILSSVYATDTYSSEKAHEPWDSTWDCLYVTDF